MRILIVLLSLLMFCSCSDEWNKKDEVSGDGLKRGTPYEILEKEGNYTVFLSAVDKAGYRDLFDGKGLSTIFVPDDAAFATYFAKKGISGVNDMDSLAVADLIGHHVLRFAYRRQELNNFQPQTGMEDLPGVNYRHPSILTPPIEAFYDVKNRKNVKVYNQTRYLSVFSDNMFTSLGVASNYNYEYFYPNTQWSAGKGIGIGNAVLTTDEIETDNGYMYKIDQVAEPLRTVYKSFRDDDNYSVVRSLFDKFLTYSYSASLSQKYAAVGDSLYTVGVESSKNYPFASIADEWTSNGVWETPQFANAFNAFMPNNQAVENYFNLYWNDHSASLPDHYYSIEELDKLHLYYLLENHILTSNPAFPDRIKHVLRNSWGQPYSFDPDVDVLRKEICSNGVFMGINKVEEPAIFRGLTKQVFQSPSYNVFAYMLSKSGLLQNLSNAGDEITLFIPSNGALTDAGYSINDPGTTLENVTIRLNSANVATSALTGFIYSHVLPFRLTEDIVNGTPTWYETEKPGTYIMIGDGKITLEDGTSVATIVNSYKDNNAYEVDKTLVPGMTTWLSLVEKDGTYAYRTWYKNNMKEKIIKSSNYFPGNQANPLTPFAVNKGIFFASHDSWGVPKTNDVPENKGQSASAGVKKEMTDWLAKHMLRVDDNAEMKVIDFQTGNLEGKTFQTAHSDVSIKILSVVPCEDVEDVLSEQLETELGRMKLVIEVTSAGKETRTAVAYGPHMASECIFFVIRNAEERFVYSE
ncbi:MAG: fasciclin domain-containing protein [Marinifilaceae bacterium]